MLMHESESPLDVARRLERRSAEKWPAIVGSLSLRRSPCIRENCRACQSGEQHLSYVLYGRIKGRRVLHSGRPGAGGPARFGQRAGGSRAVHEAERCAKALKRQRSAAKAG